MNTKAIIQFAAIAILSACTILFSLLTWIGFHIDITNISPGSIVNYNPNKIAALLLFIVTFILLLLSLKLIFDLFHQEIKGDLKIINELVGIVTIISFFVGVIAFIINIYSVKIYPNNIAKFIFLWPYTLYLVLSHPSSLLDQMLLRYDFRGLNIFYYFYLFILIFTPGITVLLIRTNIGKLADRRENLLLLLLFWIVLTFLFPFLILFLALKTRKTLALVRSQQKIQKQHIKSMSLESNGLVQGSTIQLRLDKSYFSEKLLDFLNKNSLVIGTIDQFRKGQKDFGDWGSGILIGSKDWIIDKLSTKLLEIKAHELNIQNTKDYGWQTSKLEGFTARIEASVPPGVLAGYYIGRIADDLYGLFGYGINYNEDEIN